MEELENMKMLVKQELETQLNSFEDLEIGSDEQKKAMEAFQKGVNSLQMLVDADANAERVKAEIELQKAKAEREEKEAKSKKAIDIGRLVFDGLKALLGFALVYGLSKSEVIDYTNGDILSKPVADQRKRTMNHLFSWFK